MLDTHFNTMQRMTNKKRKLHMKGSIDYTYVENVN